MHKQPFLLLGTSNRGHVLLSDSDFERHKVISGITGSGKSTFLAWIAVSLLRQGVAFSLVDPHGDLCRLILQLLLTSDFFSNKKSFDKLWFVDFNRSDAAIPFNVLRGQADSHSIANNVLEAIHRAFPTVGTTAALDNTFLACCYVLAENKRPITDIQQLLLNGAFRKSLLKHVSDPLVVQFFESKLAEKANSNLIDSTMRRSFLLTFSPQLRNTLGQVENKLDFSHIMNSGTSVLYSLGGLDDQSKRLLGCLLMVGYEQAFLSRALRSLDRRIQHCLIVDEFPLFSASGDSFSVILEQVRKYAGTLYLAHQTQSQLSKGIAGSLQNAIHIIMKAGVEDSSALVSRFYRPQEDEQSSLFSFTSPPPSIFSGVTTTTEARLIFENLQRQQAIVSIKGKAELITTPTLPIGRVDHKQLTELENAYARHLLTPLAQIATSPAPVAISSSLPSVNKRVLASSPVTPFQTYVGASGSEADVQGIVQLYGFVTVSHLAKLLSKSDTAARNKLKKLVDEGLLTVSSVPSVTGKSPLCYAIKTKKQLKGQLFLDHALATTDILLHTVMLPGVTIIDLKADTAFKVAPLQVAGGSLVPDAHVRLTYKGYVYNIYYEIDRNTETAREKIISKLNSYQALAASTDCMAVCFCVVEGGDLRVKTLRNWALDVVPDELQELFLFASIDLDALSPEILLTSLLWLTSNDGTPRPLLEK